MAKTTSKKLGLTEQQVRLLRENVAKDAHYHHHAINLTQGEQELQEALQAMWEFASRMVDKHGMAGDDTMTDDDHIRWQDAAAKASSLTKR